MGGLVVFGGDGGGGILFNDAWRWDPDAGWAELSGTISANRQLPRARFLHSGVCAGEDSILVFGGACGATCLLDDAWVLTSTVAGSGPDWMRVDVPNTGPRPSARSGHTAAWDTSSARMYLFGGQELDGAVVLDDVWELDIEAAAWTKLTSGGPAARRDAASCWLSDDQTWFVHGGWNGPSLLGDLWGLRPSASTWARISATGSAPGGLRGHRVTAMGAGRVLVHGGAGEEDDDSSRAFLGDLSGRGTWTALASGKVFPLARRHHTLEWLPGTDRVVVFGGASYTGGRLRLNDLWVLSVDRALAYPALLEDYLESQGRGNVTENEGGGGGLLESGDTVQVDLSWVDAAFAGTPQWVGVLIVFGIPGCCCLACVCTGLLRQRRIGLARKRAEEQERNAAES